MFCPVITLLTGIKWWSNKCSYIRTFSKDSQTWRSWAKGLYIFNSYFQVTLPKVGDNSDSQNHPQPFSWCLFTWRILNQHLTLGSIWPFPQQGWAPFHMIRDHLNFSELHSPCPFSTGSSFFYQCAGAHSILRITEAFAHIQAKIAPSLSFIMWLYPRAPVPKTFV